MSHIHPFAFHVFGYETRKFVGPEHAAIRGFQAEALRRDQRRAGQSATMSLRAQDRDLGVRRRVGLDVNKVVNGDRAKAEDINRGTAAWGHTC